MLAKKNAGNAFPDGFKCSSPCERAYRPAAGLRFQGNDSEVFLAGEDQHAAGLIELANRLIRLPLEKFDI